MPVPLIRPAVCPRDETTTQATVGQTLIFPSMNVMKVRGVPLRMDRRELLTRTGALLGTVSLGGCLSRYDEIPGGGGGTTTSSPTLAERSFEMTSAGCGNPTNEASVAFDSERSTVVVTGTISAQNACHRAKLAGASYDPETGTLSVTVATTPREGTQACAQCIFEIDYEATFRFEGGLPVSISVTHDGLGGSTSVTTKERPS